MRSQAHTLQASEKFSGGSMAATLLFSFRNRDEAHAKLEEVRASEGSDSRAECREDLNELEAYQVWSGPINR